MQNFDFIVDARFRVSLEHDLKEMELAFQSGSWKSTQVLAGSIVEALLIDYLMATNTPPRPGKDLLKLDLGEAVAVCKSEGVLTDRTADLSSVVRSYRNLIHPGRAVRLKESAPSRDSASIAVSLVNMIATEIAAKRQSEFGLTGEQVLSKLERDANSLAILRHLLADCSSQQLEHLLIDLIPPRYLELEAAHIADEEELFEPTTLARLRKAYRLVFDSAPVEVKRKAVERFIRSLREDDGGRVSAYSRAFLRATDLSVLQEKQRPIVVQHLLARMGQGMSHETLDQIRGVEKYLNPIDARPWIDPLIQAVTASSTAKNLRDATRKYFVDCGGLIPKDTETAIDHRLAAWVSHFEEREDEGNVEAVESMQSDHTAERLPF